MTIGRQRCFGVTASNCCCSCKLQEVVTTSEGVILTADEPCWWYLSEGDVLELKVQINPVPLLREKQGVSGTILRSSQNCQKLKLGRFFFLQCSLVKITLLSLKLPSYISVFTIVILGIGKLDKKLFLVVIINLEMCKVVVIFFEKHIHWHCFEFKWKKCSR